MTTTTPFSLTGTTRGTAPVLTATQLVHGYGSTTVLHGVDCAVARGESLALMGPSGSGKTTLLHALAGIHVPWEGRIDLAPADDASAPGGDLAGDVAAMGSEDRSRLRRSRYGLVFQSGQLLDELTAVENVALPLLAAGQSRRRAVAAATQWFAPLGLEGLDARRPGEISGGQRQRVALARALVTQPAVIFADEPTGALDRRTGTEVMTTLLNAQRHTGAALVMVTHDMDVASRCDRVLHLADGQVR